MWWKLGLLAVVTLVLIVAPFVPTVPVEITIEMPNSPSGGPSSEAQSEATLDRVTETAMWVGYRVAAFYILGVLALAGWIGSRILRRGKAHAGASQK